MNNFGDVDHQLIMLINLGLAEQVDCSHALAAVPMDSRFIDYQLLRLAVQRNETRIAQLLIDRGFRVNPDAMRRELADTPLHFAVEHRNDEMLQLLLKHYASVEHKNSHGLTALQTAVKLANFTAVDTIMRELESRGYLQRLITKEHLSTVHAACLRGDVVDFNRMLEYGISIKEPVPLGSPIWPGCTNLHLAVVSRSVKLMELLILRGIDTKTKEIMNLTALQLAVKTGDKVLVRQLLRLYVDHEVDKAVEHTDGMTYLHHACTLDKVNLNIVGAFLKKGENVNATTSLALSDAPGYTPLHFAVKHGNFNNVHTLMEYGANPTVKNGHGETPLHLTGDNPEIVAACFNNYQFYDVDTRDRYGTSHFHIACLYGRHEIVDEFIKRGSVTDLNTRIQMTPTLIAYHGSTPLQLALRLDVTRVGDDRQAKVVRKLLESPDIDVNAHDTCGLTALHIAVMTVGKFSSVEALVNHDRTDVNARDLDGQTALHLAVKCEDMFFQINCLIKYNSDLYAQDVRGRTPLHVAHKHVMPFLLPIVHPENICRRNLCDADGISIFDIACINYKRPSGRNIVDRFLQAGTVSDDAAMRGLSRAALITDVLHAAVEGRHITTVMVLLRLRLVNVNVPDAKGATALHIVAMKPRFRVPVNRSMAIARILLDAGIDIEATTLNSKRTALHRAAQYNLTDIIEFLLKNGANLSARDKWQYTPLHLAASSCNIEVVQVLIDAGADVNARDESGALPLHKVPGKLQYCDEEHPIFLPLYLRTPMERYSNLIDVLLYTPTSHGNIDAKDNTGVTPLCIAFTIDNRACAKAFLDHGADPQIVWYRLMKLLARNELKRDAMVMIAEQMIRLRAARLLKNNSFANLSWFGITNYDLADHEHNCRKELMRMTEVYVDPYTTLRDLLYKSDITLWPHLANDQLREMLVVGFSVEQEKRLLPLFLCKYPCYGLLVRRIYRRALLRLELVQEANKAIEAIALYAIPEESVARVMPEPCIEAILGMVNDDDLRNLVEAVYHKKM